MEWYSGIKFVHVISIHISITLFIIRFFMDDQGQHVWRSRPWKMVPHINDTLLLASAIGLLYITGWQIFVHFWITVKVALVVVYIILGWFALRINLARGYRWVAFIMALGVFVLIYAFAIKKFM
ncbi:SirB2 family protein [Aliidiomarina quisquiliarum]|uniref:SirB2 family protein n=1 Tax=Aliidiomarina quisquiliarum TaxID=2938947 RepID=UPI00208FD4F4|nr:SirB2 family protein [Aliidiomarina quisquiliarum]MCO4322388.1 SirB2 family protein [Aliidiomarina quisquiliarum]